MRIGITYNLKTDLSASSDSSLPEDMAEEFDLPETIEAIQDVLLKEGHHVHLLGGDLGIVEKTKRSRIEFVFNIAEGFQGRNREAHIPALLELMGIPYSGSDPLGLAITLDKSLAKRIAISHGILTPEFWVLNEPLDLKKVPRRFPLFVKPLWEGCSKGIRLSSHVENLPQLEQEVDRLFHDYEKEPVLVEEYIAGRELTVGILGNRPPEVLGVMEILFRDPAKKDFCYSLEVKRNWKEEVAYQMPAAIGVTSERQVQEAALLLFNVLRLRDIARFDFRMNSKGQIYFLEVNPLPGLSPESGDIVILAQKIGLSYRTLILKILEVAIARYPALTLSKVEGKTHA